MLLFVAWWATFLATTVLLVGWQLRLARCRARDWGGPAAYGLAGLISVGVSGLSLLLGAILLALYPFAGAGRVLGIFVLIAWGWQCRDRWAALGPASGAGWHRRAVNAQLRAHVPWLGRWPQRGR
jgi:hypothetical protein